MARQDIAGLLTGISSTQQPVQQAVPGSPNFYGEFMAARGRGLQQGLGGLMRGGEPSTQERIQGAMFELSSPTAGGAAKDTATRIADLTKLARVQQVQGNPAAAAQTAAQIQQLREQAQKEDEKKVVEKRNASLSAALKGEGYEKLAEQVALGDENAYKRGVELISPKSSVEEFVDPLTGITSKYEVIGNKVTKRLGASSLPILEIRENKDGTFQLYNSVTGAIGLPQNTRDSAMLKEQKFQATYSAIKKLDATMGILGEAGELRKDMSAVGYALNSVIPGTDARELASKVDTIQANLAFDELEEMRKNSPTGGALGNVTEKELDLLKSAVSGLDPALGEEAFNKQVKLIQTHYDRFKKALIGQADYRVDEGIIYIKAPDGQIYNVGPASLGGVE
jgi:hypothetical protein